MSGRIARDRDHEAQYIASADKDLDFLPFSGIANKAGNMKICFAPFPKPITPTSGAPSPRIEDLVQRAIWCSAPRTPRRFAFHSCSVRYAFGEAGAC